jgi:hypothetical protein
MDYTIEAIPTLPDITEKVRRMHIRYNAISEAENQINLLVNIVNTLKLQVKLGAIDYTIIYWTKQEENYADDMDDSTASILMSLMGRKYTGYHDFFPDIAFISNYNYRYNMETKEYILSIHNHLRKIFMVTPICK